MLILNLFFNFMKFCFALIIIITACNTNTAITGETAARSLLDTIISADNRADISVVLSCYSRDAVLMPPGKLSIAGISDIEENYKNIFSNSILHLQAHVDKIEIFPSYAVITGTNTGSVVLKKDSSVSAVNDKFMMLLEKREKTWKINRLIWNKNQ